MQKGKEVILFRDGVRRVSGRSGWKGRDRPTLLGWLLKRRQECGKSAAIPSSSSMHQRSFMGKNGKVLVHLSISKWHQEPGCHGPREANKSQESRALGNVGMLVRMPLKAGPRNRDSQGHRCLGPQTWCDICS